jgi:hypothetical protein
MSGPVDHATVGTFRHRIVTAPLPVLPRASVVSRRGRDVSKDAVTAAPAEDALMANRPATFGAQGGDDGGIGGDADHSAGAPWLVVVVRAWTHENRRIVRMTRSVVGRTTLVCFEASSAAAGRRLTQWLDDPSAQLVDPAGQNAAEDGPETPRRRSGIGTTPTVKPGRKASVAGHRPTDPEPEVGQPEPLQRREKET